MTELICDAPFDLDRFRLTTLMTAQPTLMSAPPPLAPPTKKPKFKVGKIDGEFLRGPIPLSWLSRASELRPRASLAVGLAIWFAVGLRESYTVTLTTAFVSRFGVNRKAKYRGLRSLLGAGLITLEQKPKRNPLVTVVLQEPGSEHSSTEHSSTEHSSTEQTH